MKIVEATAEYSSGGYPMEHYTGIRSVSGVFTDETDLEDIREELCIRARQKIAHEYGRTTANVHIVKLTIDKIT